ncbi:hypothetical protein [Azorhizophilus paspali]|uniref:Uncharacterized protein n=1 Tax=Azorhizophilus paspali TaxID=69963 RepID=A0ABV6SR57_AZOPA
MKNLTRNPKPSKVIANTGLGEFARRLEYKGGRAGMAENSGS